MSGRHRGASAASARARRPATRWLAAVIGLAVAALTVILMQPAGANPVNVRAQLALSGVVTAASPIGGSTIGIHPGDSVTFQASLAPTAGLDALGLSFLVDTLNLFGGVTMVADFSKLPGAAKFDTATTHATAYPLTGTASAAFSFAKPGTYPFTWSAKTLFGIINLDGNQLAAAGIKLNASNQWVGQIVVADNPPAGGISVQLPGVGVAPSLPVVGQLPSVGLPPVTLPTIPVTVPGVLPGLPGVSVPGTGTKPGTAPDTDPKYSPPPLSVPERVMPKGDGAVIGPDLNASAVLALSLAGVTNPLPAQGVANTHRQGTPSAAPSSAPAALAAAHPVSERPIEIAAGPQTPSGTLPMILALVSIIALSLVTATYARLYLLRKPR